MQVNFATRDLTENRIRRGTFLDIEQLIMAIGDYIDKRARKALDNRYSACRTTLIGPR